MYAGFGKTSTQIFEKLAQKHIVVFVYNFSLCAEALKRYQKNEKKRFFPLTRGGISDIM